MSETQKVSKGQEVEFTYGGATFRGIVYGPSGRDCVNIQANDTVYRVKRENVVKI